MLRDLLRASGIEVQQSVTLLAEDQYVVHLSRDTFEKRQALVVFEANGKPVGRRHGGPLKLVFSDDYQVRRDAYIWYLSAVIADNMLDAKLTLRTRDKALELTSEQLAALPFLRQRQGQPIPKGFWEDLVPVRRDAPITGFYLEDLLQEHLGKASRIELKPHVGHPLLLTAQEVARLPIFIVTQVEGRPIPMAHGGPFTAIFPADHARVLVAPVPEASGLFFLREIIVR